MYTIGENVMPRYSVSYLSLRSSDYLLNCDISTQKAPGSHPTLLKKTEKTQECDGWFWHCLPPFLKSKHSKQTSTIT